MLTHARRVAKITYERSEMANMIAIYVECSNDADIEWLRDKCVPAVEEIVAENAERLDGTAEVSWDVVDEETA